ncbi:hypothetical protein TcWFU_004449 [Taenia crassiceps]|uniref:Uncharacterized protein n=1 Tax=Taenia crassiceps TaxID=6207 RepID=A0ABR4Q6P0_9CEST
MTSCPNPPCKFVKLVTVPSCPTVGSDSVEVDSDCSRDQLSERKNARVLKMRKEALLGHNRKQQSASPFKRVDSGFLDTTVMNQKSYGVQPPKGRVGKTVQIPNVQSRFRHAWWVTIVEDKFAIAGFKGVFKGRVVVGFERVERRREGRTASSSREEEKNVSLGGALNAESRKRKAESRMQMRRGRGDVSQTANQCNEAALHVLTEHSLNSVWELPPDVAAVVRSGRCLCGPPRALTCVGLEHVSTCCVSPLTNPPIQSDAPWDRALSSIDELPPSSTLPSRRFATLTLSIHWSRGAMPNCWTSALVHLMFVRISTSFIGCHHDDGHTIQPLKVVALRCDHFVWHPNKRSRGCALSWQAQSSTLQPMKHATHL